MLTLPADQRRMFALAHGGPCKRERERREAIDRKELRAQHSNKVFRAAVLARVKEVLGGIPEVDQSETIKHVAQTDDWRITTSIALKGKFPMRYTQYLTSTRGLSQRHPSTAGWESWGTRSGI
jgi:hypothetical protein